MDSFKPSDDFLKTVAEFNPDLARPALWDTAALESFLPDGAATPLYLFVRRVLDNVLKRGPTSVEPALITMYILGYYAALDRRTR